MHIPTLCLLSDYFEITYLCDVSSKLLAHCAKRVPGCRVKTTTSHSELCSSDDVDAVLICSATAFHTSQAITALQNNKHVLVEKPVTVSFRDLEDIVSAERQSQGKVSVGYNRRFAPSFLDAIREIGDIKAVQYARVRDIIGPNEHFIGQSGTYSKKFNDISSKNSETMARLDRDMNDRALKEFNVTANDDTRLMLFALSGLGSHDFSAMREALGMPQSVQGAKLQMPLWTATFDYGSFAVVYESGSNDVPVFDCHIEVYTPDKIVRVNYDTPFIKGLPITMTVREKVPGPTGEAYFQCREVRSTYEDTYTLEHKDWYNSIVTGGIPKCNLSDSRQDLEIYGMLLRAGYGTTPGTQL